MDWRAEEQRGARERIRTQTHSRPTEPGILRWNANDAVVPPHVYKDAGLECPADQRAAYEADLDVFLAEYRKARENHVPSAEEMFEMRAAFGPGATVVDVITGRRTKL